MCSARLLSPQVGSDLDHNNTGHLWMKQKDEKKIKQKILLCREVVGRGWVTAADDGGRYVRGG